MLVPGYQSWNPVKLVFLVDSFWQRQEARLGFLPKFDNVTTCDAIHRYQVSTNNAIMHMNYVYSYYSHFIHLSELKIILIDNLVAATAFVLSIFCLD